MEISSILAVILIIYLVLPGYVLLRIANDITPRYSNSQIETLLLDMTYSMIASGTYLCCAKICTQLPVLDPSSENPDAQINKLILMCATILIISSVLGVVLGCIRRLSFLNCIYDKLHLNINSSQSSWDYMFENISPKEKRYLIVYLKDGSKIYGVFGSESHASMSATGQRELFLQEACIGEKKDESRRIADDTYEEQSMSRNVFDIQRATKGVYISSDMISCIKLYLQ